MCVEREPHEERFRAVHGGGQRAQQGRRPFPGHLTEEGPTGKTQIFVNRLDRVARNRFLNVGGSLNVEPDRNASQPSITFVGTVPFVAWNEEVGSTQRVFVRHLASDPQTGTWALDTPPGGLALDKTKSAVYPIIRASADGKTVFIYREGDPKTGASQILVCTNSPVTGFLQRALGLAAPLAAGKAC